MATERYMRKKQALILLGIILVSAEVAISGASVNGSISQSLGALLDGNGGERGERRDDD
jgi:hypothetical protein